MGLIAAGVEAHVDRPARRHLRAAGRADLAARTACCCSRSRASIITDSRGTLAEQVNRRAPRRSARCRALDADAHASAASAPPAPVAPRDLILFNGLGGFTPDGREYVIAPTPATTTPAPWVNVLANPHFGTRRVRERQRLHLERERARVPPDAVAQRSGQRRQRRGVLPARRGDRAVLVADAAAARAATAPYVTRHGFGYSVFEHIEDGIASELCGLRRARRAGQVLGAEGAQRFRPRRAGCRRPATSNGCWATCAPKSAMHVVTEIDPTSGALFARNAYNTEFADRVAFFDVDERDAHASPATAPSSSAATARCAIPRRMRAHAAVRQGRRGARSLRRDPGAVRPRRRARSARSCSGSASGATAPTPRSAGAALPRRRRPRATRSRRCAQHWSARSARCRSKRPTRRSTCWPTAGSLPDARLPPVGAQRLLPVGRRVRFPRPVAGRDGAGARRAARLRAQHLLLCAAPPVRRRRRAALVASAVGPRRAHALLGRLPVAAARDLPLRQGDRRHRRARRDACRSSKAAPVNAEEESYYDLPGRSDEVARRSTSIACARSSTACASARTACR